MEKNKGRSNWSTGDLKTVKVKIKSKEPVFSDFKIENEVPVPSYTKVRIEFPLERLGVGQSFFIPFKKGSGFNSVGSQIADIHKGPANRKYFITRVIRDAGGNILGKRVWRKQ